MNEIEMRIQKYKEQFLKDLASLVAIPSIRHEQSKAHNAPFGKGVAKAMDKFCEIAQRLEFQTENCDGYASYAQLGNGNAYIGVLAHLDVVDILYPKEWKSDPFCMDLRDEILYGRGVNDDKGPLLAALYAMRILADMQVPLKHPIRLIAGGAEETTWECMDYYFKKYPQPICGFSPDGNFPIVNGEKGIACYSFQFPCTSTEIHIECREKENWVNEDIVVRFYQKSKDELLSYAKRVVKIEVDGEDVLLYYKGKRAMSRNPQRGDNALFSFIKDFKDYPFINKGNQNLMSFFDTCLCDDFYGKKAGIYYEDSEMGMTSICPCSIQTTEFAQEVYLDIRFVKGIDKDTIDKQMNTLATKYDATLEVKRYKRLLYVDEQSTLIQALKKAYKNVMKEEAEVFTKGGASYARVLDQGVAFGATFANEDPNPHMPNEHMPVASLLKAMEIYVHALIELASDEKM